MKLTIKSNLYRVFSNTAIALVFALLITCGIPVIANADFVVGDSLGFMGSNDSSAFNIGENIGFMGNNDSSAFTVGPNIGYMGSNDSNAFTVGPNIGYMGTQATPDTQVLAPGEAVIDYAPAPGTATLDYAPITTTRTETIYPGSATNVYNVYGGGYPYSYGAYPYGFGSSFNFGLFYSNLRTPSFVNPVVVSTPIVYSTPIITQPSVAYVTPVTQTIPQYNVQSYLPSYNYNYQAPSCSITASNSNANYNYYNNYYNNYNYNYSSGQMLLTWYSNGANSAYISPSVGSVSTSGSTTVFAPGSQTYTLTVSGPGGIATCQTTTYSNTYAYNYTPPQVYNNYVAPTPPVYQAPTTPYVALTQIPYTGLDLGPVGNALYWLALALFAIAGGYLVVYYQGGASRLLNGLLGSDGPVPVRTVARAEEVVSKPATVSPVSRSNTGSTSSPQAAFGTKDSMKVEKSFNGDAPRIVIVRA